MANGVAYWPVELMCTAFETECDREGIDPDERPRTALGVESQDTFWERARTNLQAGKLR
jgi:hypothetical protein